MNHILLTVGSSKYDDVRLTELPGAQSDCDAVYDILVTNGIYSKDYSKKLSSPSLEELRKELNRVVTLDLSPKIITFHFSGHGGANGDYYYLCVRDTNQDQLAMSGFAVDDLLRFFSESNASEINLILDSCYSGGVSNELGKVLNQNRFGHYGSVPYTIMASAYADQTASECDAGGLLTQSLVGTIKNPPIKDPGLKYVGLIDIAEAVTLQFKEKEIQSPVYWGLSLSGPGLFIPNKYYDSAKGYSFQLIAGSGANLSFVTSDQHNQLLSLYSNLHEDINCHEIFSAFREIFHEKDNAAVNLINLKDRFFQKSKENRDIFAPIDILNTFLGLGLLIKDENDRAKYVLQVGHQLLEELKNSLVQMDERKDEIELFLPGDSIGGMVLYPIRVTELISHICYYRILHRNLKGGEIDIESSLSRLTDWIFTKNLTGIRMTSDIQAEHISVILHSIWDQKKDERLEKVLGYLLVSLIEKPEILSCHFSGEDIFKFIPFQAAKGHPDQVIPHEIFSNPQTALFLLTAGVTKLGQEADLNKVIHLLDGRAARIFVPDSYSDFTRVTVQNGFNFEMTIGRTVWEANNIRDVFNKTVLPAISKASSQTTKYDWLASMGCQRAMPDRAYFGFSQKGI